MCLPVNPASIAVPSGAEAGHVAPGGRRAPAEGLRPEPQRGLQDRPGWPAFSKARLGEGQSHRDPNGNWKYQRTEWKNTGAAKHSTAIRSSRPTAPVMELRLPQ